MTPGGGCDAISVDARKAARSRDVVVAAEAITDDILGTADNEIKMKMNMKR